MKLRSKKMLSIDFGTRSIKIAQGIFKKGKLSISGTFNLNLPEGVYEDGYIKDKNTLIEIIDSFLKFNNIKTQDTVAVINSSDILTRDVMIPNLSEDEIDGILKYKITDYIPINPEDYLVQYIHEDVFLEDKNQKLKLFIVAMPKTIVEQHFNLLKDLDLKPRVLDFQSNSIRKLLYFNGKIQGNFIIKGKTIASIDIGFFSTKLTIVKDYNIDISRIIPLGIKNIFENVDTNFNLTESEILNIAHIQKKENLEDWDFEEKLEIDLALNNFLSRLFDGIEMIFRYYNSQGQNNIIDLILLHGNIPNVIEVKEKLEKYLNIKTLGVDSLTGILDKDLNLYSNAIGSLIRGEDI